jgi:hypothetical protein
MFYYRYRPSGELSLKELRYNEIYFSSASESNDPYDGKVFLSYKFDKDKWKRLLETAWKGVSDSDTLLSLVDPLSIHLEKYYPTSFEEAISYDYKSILLAINDDLEPLKAHYLDQLIKQFIDTYRPGVVYTVSFSKTNSNTLMWSHYASKHKGFCLIFKAINGFLYQDKEHRKDSVSRITSKGIAPSTGFGIPDRFPFEDIKYCSNIETIDASRFMSRYIFNKKIANEEERIKFATENDRKCLEKHICWCYEEEARILLEEPLARFFGEHFDYSQEERIKHYQPTQLVGIILGALMESKTKQRIHEIISGFRERITRSISNEFLFDFVLFEASISDKHRDVNIVPKEIFMLSDVISKDDPQFNSRLKEWEEGWALVYHETGGSSKEQFP